MSILDIRTSNEILAILVFLITTWLGVYIMFGSLLKKKALQSRFYKEDYGKENSLISRIKKTEEEMTFMDKLQRDIDRARIKMSANGFLAISLLVALGLGILGLGVLKAPLFGIILFGVGLIIPRFYLKSKREKFEKQFDTEMVKALRRMGSILRVGGSLDQALNDVTASTTIPEIVKYEFANVYASYKAGFSINEAFYELYKSIGSKDTLYLCVAIDIQMETGGDKADVMDSIATHITNKNLKQKGIKAKLAEIDISVKFMAMMPIIFGAIIRVANPNHFDFFTSSFFGQLIAFLIVGFMVFGYFVIKKMSKIEMD